MKTGTATWRRLQSACVLMVLLGIGRERSVSAAQKAFTLSGATLTLEDSTADVDVYFTSMRFNRAANLWNVEVGLSNHSARVLSGPFVMLVEGYSGTSGPLQPDGTDESAKGFYDLSGAILDGELAPGECSLTRTLSLGFTSGAPDMTTRVFTRPVPAPAALALTRTLDEAGQPLPDVEVIESGPLGVTTNRTDPIFGVLTLGQASGAHTWQFVSPGFLTVWRLQTLSTNEVTIVPDPRLVHRGTNSVTLTPIAGGQITNTSGTIQINFPAAAFVQNTVATLTPLTGQTLPAFLPLGWSPLQAFSIELGNEAVFPGAAILTLWGSLGNGETAAWVRWNPATLQWDVLQLLSGNGATTLTATVPGSGAYALVVGDATPNAPPAPQAGRPLIASAASLPDLTGLKAIGTVEPASSPASRVPGLVTATATVIVTNPAGPLPSGVLLRGEVQEQYRLRDGTTRHPPQYESFVVGYQRPGDGNSSTLHASFPLRPLLLFGGEELDAATVTMDMLTPTPFTGGVLDTNGGLVASEGIRVLAGAGDLASRQAAQLRKLDAANFPDFATNGISVLAAFELNGGGVATGRHLTPQFGPLPTNGAFVLARVLYDQGLYGLQPVERLTSDAAGRLAGAEPLSGEKLAGLNGAGQYVLLQLPTSQALLEGIAKKSNGQPAGGLPVRIAGQPWLAFSATDGAFKLLAPTGMVGVVVTDLATGDTGSQTVSIPDIQTGATVNLAAVLSGPQVVSVTPTNNATAVSRVTSIVVAFSKPVNPATLLNGGLQVIGTNAVPVTASLSLNLQNTVATLLPADPLAPSTLFTISLSTNITDAGGVTLTGPIQFAFTTASDSLDRPNAQFIIYEPTNGWAPVSGTPGSADPASPVILVNDTSGQTATILSKTDGSFTNFIAADVEDFISAVLVNQNGTRTTLPASRQIFRDGSVGLFRGGGIIEAQSSNGPVQVVVEPGSIPNKSKFSLSVPSFAEVLALVKNTAPADGKLLGGVNFKVQGDRLRTPAQLRFPVTEASLDLPPGVAPDQASYAVTVPRDVNGVTAYQYVDKMKFSNGYLQTNPGILDTAEFMIIKARNGNQLPVTGRAISAIRGLDSNNQPLLTDIRPVPGAVVLINPAGLALITSSGNVAPGALVAVADENGGFSLLVTGGSLIPSGNSFSLLAISPLFPGKLGTGSAAPHPDVDVVSATGDVVFDRGAPALNNAGPDHVPPMISATHFPRNPAVSNATRLVVLANDDQQISTATVTLQSVDSLDSANPAAAADVTLNIVQQIQQSPQTLRQEYDVTGKKPLRANLLISTADASQNPQSVLYPIEFGGGGSVLVNPTPDPGDTNSPFVVSSSPVIGAENVLPGTPITINFNEPIDSGFTQNVSLAFQLQPPAGTPGARLSDDQRSVTLTYYALQPGTAYNLLVTSTIQDINGNGLDQNPYNSTPFESFTLPFKTVTFASTALPGVVSGGGMVAIGRTLFVLDRAGPMDGALVVIDGSDPGQPKSITQFDLDSFPRDITAIPNYAFKRTLNGPTVTNNLLVIVGGTVGGEGQWIKVLNVTDPAHPATVAATLATRSSEATLTKLAWLPPLLGYLESDADITSVSLVNLQLFIYAQNLSAADFNNEPAAGDPGLDLNGDGDYVDPGEKLPRPASALPRSGLINNGLVATYTLRDETWQRIYDFDLGFGGAFVGIVTGPGNELTGGGQPSGPPVPAQYITLVNGHARQDRTKTSLDLPVTPKRLTALFGVPLDLGGSNRVANLALVSLPPNGAQPGEILVIDITTLLSPVQLSEILIPAVHGVPQSILRRDDGLLMLATSQDVLLLDPSRLGLPLPSPGGVHPALVGLIPGMGSGARSFAGTSDPLFALALGGDNRVVGLSGRIDLVLHQPGTIDSPGPVVPEAVEDQNDQTVVFVNDDADSTSPAFTLAPPPDFTRSPHLVFDNDLLMLTVAQVPPTLNQKGAQDCRAACHLSRSRLERGHVGGPVRIPASFHADQRQHPPHSQHAWFWFRVLRRTP